MSLEGMVLTIKPAGMTSHDVVDSVRELTGVRRVGHTGTLDPTAEGLLPVLVARATRLSEYMLELPKRYRAELVFGVETASGDSLGTVTAVYPAEAVQAIEETRLQAALEASIGPQLQVPPMTSARRYHGKRLYELARAGETVARQPKEINVVALELIKFMPAEGTTYPRALVDILCSSGTYVRTLCADIGHSLGVGAYVSYLLRVAVGPYSVNDAYTLEELSCLEPAEKQAAFISLGEITSWMPRLGLERSAANGVLHGLAPDSVNFEEQLKQQQAAPMDSGHVRLVGPDDEFLAIATLKKSPAGKYITVLEKVFPRAGLP